jgi:hypothetical protein
MSSTNGREPNEIIKKNTDMIKAIADMLGASASLVRATITLLTALVALFVSIFFIGKSCTGKPVTPEPSPDSKEVAGLYDYLACVDAALSEMGNGADAAKTIDINTVKAYKSAAIDMPSFQMYPDRSANLNGSEKKYLKDYMEKIRAELQNEAAKYAITLPNCEQ